MSRPSLTDRLRGIVAGGAAFDSAQARKPPPLPESDSPSPESNAVPRLAPELIFGRGGASAPPAIAFVPPAIGKHAAAILGGEWIERAEGRVLIVDRFYAGAERYGREGIDDLVETLTAGGDAIATLDGRWPSDADVARPQLLFLDLETTGLAGGAGTQAFLVGCAFIEDEGIRVRQFVLPGYEHERALLAEVAAWTAPPDACLAEARGSEGERRRGLVTFNGRTFDLPLIETRYLFHRLRFPLADVPHLDMLHSARRLWKTRPAIAGPPLDDDSCRLSVLERHLGGVHRVGDVPGFEIPSRYFQFVRDGDARPLEAVLEHNRLDLLSLALVTARAIRLIERGPSHTTHAWESLGLGRVYERAGARQEAEACYLHAADLARRIGREPAARAEALRRLAVCRRRDGRLHDAALAWEELLDAPSVPATLRHEAREALAIHYEHRAKDLRTARMLVMDTLADDHTEAHYRAATHRLQRLDRKLRVRSEGGLLAALEAFD